MRIAIALLFALCLSAHGQAMRNLNGFGTNVTLRGILTNGTTVISGAWVITNFNTGVVGVFSAPGISLSTGGNDTFIATTANGNVSFTGVASGNGGGLTNLIGATNFSSSVTYNFNGKTTFNSVSYNTNAWAGPTNTLVLGTNYQDFVATTDCNINVVGGQIAGQNTWATLTVSNSTASPITVRVTATGIRTQGANTTTALAIGAGKEGILSFLSRDFKSTNLVTSAQSN